MDVAVGDLEVVTALARYNGEWPKGHDDECESEVKEGERWGNSARCRAKGVVMWGECIGS